jgi:hypothetical protein
MTYQISNQNGVRETGFIPSPETNQYNKVYETMVFKTVDIRQQKTVIPEKWGRKEKRPVIALLTVLRGSLGCSSGIA